MFNISSFLEKLSKNINSQELNSKMICDVIYNKTNIFIPKESIKTQNAILYLDINPAMKNKIFIHKQSILEEMAHTTPKIIDIR